MKTSSPALQELHALDRADPLRAKREEFLLPDEVVYLNGNSLGPLTRQAKQRMSELMDEQWGADLIASWNKHGWIDLPFAVGEKIAELIGAAPGQLVCCDSVSINLIKLLACCLHSQPSRKKVLSQVDNFPTDLYAAQGLTELLGSHRCELVTVTEDKLVDAMTDEVAVLLLTEVNFRSGDRHDMAQLTALAKSKGILLIWDLSHSVGVMPLELDEWGVDFAVGCGYKYLNGGPGAPAFIYANKRHHAKLKQPLQGWMGHRDPFQFDPAYSRGAGMTQFLVGTPPILSLSTLDAALDVFDAISIIDVYEKAMRLSELFAERMGGESGLSEFTPVSNSDTSRRGAHLAYAHEEAYSICRALIKEGVVVDFRSPDIIRFGFSPLFLRFADIQRAVDTLKRIMIEEIYRAEEFSQKLKVT